MALGLKNAINKAYDNTLVNGLWSKAYFILILNESGNTVDSFTFSLPPESEEFTQTQRVSETPTFGGTWFDDYGSNAVKISLSGSTGNRMLKKSYKVGASQSEEKWDGETEILYLWTNIIKYKTKSNLSNKEYGNYVVYLYDLSKLTTNKAEKGVGFWRVFINDFTYKRDKSKPYQYNYTLEMTAVDIPTPPSPIDAALFKGNDVEEKLNGIQKIGALLKDAYNAVYEAASIIDKVNNAAQKAMSDFQTWSNAINGIIAIGTNALETTTDTLRFGRTTIESVVSETTGSIAQFFISSSELVTQAKDFFIFATVELWTTTIPENVLYDYGMTEAAFKEMTAVLADDQLSNALYANSVARSNDAPIVASNVLTGLTETTADGVIVQTSLNVYGYDTYTARQNETFETIAKDKLGDPDYAFTIASYNGMIPNDLEAGTVLKIPIIDFTKSNPNNLIYDVDTNKDQYGKDIKIDSLGDIEIDINGDLAVTSGAANLSQAIFSRLGESKEKRIRQNTYGIVSAIGDPVAGSTYVLQSIEQTVKADPRVNDIQDIFFDGSGDSLTIEFSYTDTLGDNNKFKGVI